VDADLREAELNGADLSGADLTGAKLDGAAGAGAPEWRHGKDPETGPVKDNARTRWPSGFKPAKDLKEVFRQADTPTVRSRGPQGGHVIICGNQCFQELGGARSRATGALVEEPAAGDPCRTAAWNGTWQRISRETRKGPSDGGAMQRDGYREAIEGAGSRGRLWRRGFPAKASRSPCAR
jgi:hypothetical protein